MAEYIERAALLKKLKGSGAICDFGEHLIEQFPTADVAPVVYSRWAHLGGDEWCCSACGFVITTEVSWDKPTKKYCEDCGAKMQEVK